MLPQNLHLPMSVSVINMGTTVKNLRSKMALAAGMFVSDILASDFSKLDLNRSTLLLNLEVKT